MRVNKRFGLLIIAVLLIIIYVSFIKTYNEHERTPTINNITLNESAGIQNTDNITFNESGLIPNDEYEVYSAILLQKNYSKSVNKIVILQMTANKTFEDDTDAWESSIKNFESYTGKRLDVALVDDFKKKNTRTYILENKFSIPQNVVLISKKELNEIFTKEKGLEKGWDAFYQKYLNSSGIVEISRAGFNDNKTQAIIYFSNKHADLGGEGDLVFLAIEEGKWIVKEQVMLWIS